MMRTYGETQNCAGCRFWSEMIAQVIGGGPLEALCLSQDSRFAGKYTTARRTREAWKAGPLGAINDPYEDNVEAYKRLDAEEPTTPPATAGTTKE